MTDPSGPDQITVDTVRHVARLARLRIDDDQADLYARQIGRILDHVRSIQALDLEGVEPMAHPGDRTLALRDDQPAPPLARQTLMDMAPEAAPPFIKVPKVLPGAADRGA